MNFEGVVFIESAVKKMSKTQFVERHIDAFWRDRGPEQRKAMLEEAYDIINPPKNKTKKEK